MSTGIALERLTGRIQELYASATQFAAARFGEAFSAAIERPGLRLSQLVGSPPRRRLCVQWPRWSPEGSNHRRWSPQ
jgi:hypothetical protein